MVWTIVLGLLISRIASVSSTSPYAAVCANISHAVSSSSDVYLPGLFEYYTDIGHWASSSTQEAACSVEPGTAEDVAVILQIIAANQTPFAVKGGGHSSNPGFSSTAGVQIAMYRFGQVTVNAGEDTVTIGSGLIWDDVYDVLVPQGLNVVGGRVTGVGVAGFTLGGGYSWKSNQYGLTVDTVTAYELVKPTGEIVTVTESSDSELFFGLKGGLNNFGIVTSFTLKTFPQTDVWGGLMTFTFDHIDDVNAAAAKFAANVTDPKAAIISTYNFVLGQPGVSQLMFYDGPTPPDGIFDDFLAIPYFTKDVETRDFTSLVLSSPANATAGTRAYFNSVPILSYSDTLLKTIANESAFWGLKLGLASGSFISYDVEPFLLSAWSHATSDTAYPPASSRSSTFLPLNIYYAWGFELDDKIFYDAIKSSSQNIRNVAVSEGQTALTSAPLYPNYALFDTPLEDMYSENVPRLQALKAVVDPNNVMGLAGGFKF